MDQQREQASQIAHEFIVIKKVSKQILMQKIINSMLYGKVYMMYVNLLNLE